jgi:molybdate/tungstate transport system substrate-binding protein
MPSEAAPGARNRSTAFDRGAGRRPAPWRPAAGTVAALVAASLTGCAAHATSSTTAAAKGSGPVDVLYAGSLLDLMQYQIGPAFEHESGYSVSGYSAGSTALATEIKGGTQQGDVFMSASPAVNTTLEGSANGDWVSWYIQFADSPLVLGYRPTSTFAHDLKTKPWYEVVNQPGFLLGRTDPATDPKGALAVEALDQAVARHRAPGLTSLATSTTNVFPETTLVGRLQAGQLDGAFFYGVEAAAAHIETVALAGTSLAGAYTVTILNRAPHEAAARAFVAFLLGPEVRKILQANGVEPITPPKVTGASSLPAALKAAVAS